MLMHSDISDMDTAGMIMCEKPPDPMGGSHRSFTENSHTIK